MTLVGIGAGMVFLPAHAACPESPAQVEAHAVQVERAFADMDTKRFSSAIVEMREGVGCLTGTPTAFQVAEIHLAEALAWFQAGDHARTVAAFRAMIAAEPRMRLADDVAPPGGLLVSRLFEAISLAPSPTDTVELEGDLKVFVDGVLTREIPTDRPALVVVLSPEQMPVWSGIAVGLPLPLADRATGAMSPVSTSEVSRSGDVKHPTKMPLASALPSSTESGQDPGAEVMVKPARRRVSNALLISAGSSALASAIIWTAYVPVHGDVVGLADEIRSGATVEETGVSRSEAESLVERARGLEIGAQVTMSVAFVFGSAGMVLRW